MRSAHFFPSGQTWFFSKSKIRDRHDSSCKIALSCLRPGEDERACRCYEGRWTCVTLTSRLNRHQCPAIRVVLTSSLSTPLATKPSTYTNDCVGHPLGPGDRQPLRKIEECRENELSFIYAELSIVSYWAKLSSLGPIPVFEVNTFPGQSWDCIIFQHKCLGLWWISRSTTKPNCNTKPIWNCKKPNFKKCNHK